MKRAYSDEGVVLARKNYGEADRIIYLFTRRYGRESLIAKGVRRPKSRKRGHLEIFSYIKFSASLGNGLGMLTEVETVDDYKEIRKNLKKVALAYYFMEVVGRTTRDGEPNEALFKLIVGHLNQLKTAHELKKLRLDFVHKLLTLLGFWPEGKPLINPDYALEEVIERNINSARVGKKLAS